MDVAILVVSVCMGIRQQTIEHILLAKQMGVSSFVVFFNKMDMIDEPDTVESYVYEGEDSG